MNVIGIDADRRRIAVAQRLGGVKTARTIQRTDTKGRVLPMYCEALTGLMRDAGGRGAVIFLEGIYLPATGSAARNVETFRVLANVQGEILLEAARYGVEVRLVPPTQWQKRVLGICRDRVKLKEAAITAARGFMREGLTEHESDAACLCLYGLWALRNEEVA